MILDSPQVGNASKEAANNPPDSPNSHSQTAPRTGILPPFPDLTEEEEDEVIEIVDAPETATSSDQSSARTKSTRRGSKGGKKHRHTQQSSPKSSVSL